MNAGELFINIGIKGAEKTLSTIEGVKTGIGKVASASLEAKAAVLGMMYAIERMTSSSIQAGTALNNFSLYTGSSTKELQQWEYAAKRAGVTVGDVEGSVKSLQKAMLEADLGHPPAGLATIQSKVPFDIERARKDPTGYGMAQLRKYAQLEKDTTFANKMLESLGLTPGMIALLRSDKSSPSELAKAPFVTNDSIKKLAELNDEWAKTSIAIDMAFSKLTTEHMESLKVLLNIFKELVIATTDLVNALLTAGEKLSSIAGSITGITKSDFGKFMTEGHLFPGFESGVSEFFKSITPSIGAPNEKSNVYFNQQYYFQHDGSNASDVGRATERANHHTLGQFGLVEY